jgi:hypothetical protein
MQRSPRTEMEAVEPPWGLSESVQVDLLCSWCCARWMRGRLRRREGQEVE